MKIVYKKSDGKEVEAIQIIGKECPTIRLNMPTKKQPSIYEQSIALDKLKDIWGYCSDSDKFSFIEWVIEQGEVIEPTEDGKVDGWIENGNQS